MITPFLNARQGWASREIFHPDLLEILDDTEGVVVFHEQVIEIIATLGGITLAEADEKRERSAIKKVNKKSVTGSSLLPRPVVIH